MTVDLSLEQTVQENINKPEYFFTTYIYSTCFVSGSSSVRQGFVGPPLSAASSPLHEKSNQTNGSSTTSPEERWSDINLSVGNYYSCFPEPSE